ncbi:binder of sperm protein homolog 1-like [Nannospalax galili]|uniref:binder of sperm protein homolog 1-like n=1 Tax=Nannospalax galili TaxID=1026970 RepID=UPI0004ED1DAF|nr:binder of sperm protein homolog 1-like [Nannospalax galili]
MVMRPAPSDILMVLSPAHSDAQIFVSAAPSYVHMIMQVHVTMFTSKMADSIIRQPEAEDGECVFPFRYRSGLFYDCVRFNAKHHWCSLNETFQGYWKYCALSDHAQCAFPFWFRRMIYWDCTEDGEVYGRKWCSLTPNYNKDKIWKYCE